MELLHQVNANIAALNPYQPGKPIDAVARELGLTDIVKLASNENPRGPGERVQQAISAASTDLSRYPDGGGYTLKATLAQHLGVQPEQITLGNGSNDVLDLMARVAVEPGFEAIVAEHSFVVYRLAVTCCGGTLVTAPASQAPDNRYGADLDAMLASITPKTRVIFLANPNNPTGTWVKRDALKAFLDQVPAHVWVVLDEAYFEYVDDPEYPDGLALLSDYPNLLVTRTFSKIHGLAALRLGFGVSHPELADLLNRVRQPFNVNAIAMAAALAALQDQEFISESQQLNAAGLRQMRTALETMGYDCIPSVGNFISFDCGVPGGTLFQALLQEGVIVRPIAEYGLPNHIRVSIGLPAENQRFIDALQTVRTTLASTQVDAQHSAQQ